MKRSDLSSIALSAGPLIFLVLAPFCIGAILAVSAGFDYWAFREVTRHGAEAEAQVHILRMLDDEAYASEVSWIDRDGTRRSVQMSLSHDYVLNNKARLEARGVTIRYLADNSWARPVVVGDEDETLAVIRGMLKFAAITILASVAFGVIGLLVLWIVARLGASAPARTAAARNRREPEEARKLVERLPFETVIVSGHEAFATWERLRAAGHGYPVVLGNEQEVADLFRMHAMEQHARMVAAAGVLEKAQQLDHPADLRAKRRADAAQAHERLTSLAAENTRFSVPKFVFVDAQGRETKQPDDETRAWLLREPGEDEPPPGEWPDDADGSPGLSVIGEIVSSEQDGQRSYNIKIKERVVVGILPVSHSHEVLAYLLYGNWNACPPAEYHVVAQRSWSERYGAEIVGVTGDTLNIRVARKPKTRDEALELAREHYIYCNDVIDQGAGTASNLAAQLMQHKWWFFWWD